MRSSTIIPSIIFYIGAVGGNSTAMVSSASSLSSPPLIDTRDRHRALVDDGNIVGNINIGSNSKNTNTRDNVFTATTRARIGQPVDDTFVRDNANRDNDTDTVIVQLEAKRSSAGDDAGEEGNEVGTPKQEVVMMPAWEAKGIISSIMGYSYEQTRSSEEDPPPPPSQPSSYLDNRNESESVSTTTTNTKYPALLIVGILVGMLAMIAVIIVLGLQHIRRRRQRRHQQHPESNLVLEDGYEDELSPAQYSSDSITLLDSVTILSPHDNPTRSSDGSISDNKIYKYNDNPNEC